jgi:hypothetical protein
MKKALALVTVLILLFGCVSVSAEGAEGLTEVRCDGWRFSVRIPAGMKAVPYEYRDPDDDERTIGGGLEISGEGTDGLPQLWILRRDHAFNNPYFYLTGFWWDDLNNKDMLFEDTGFALSEHGGITLYGSGCRFLGDDNKETFREYRFIPYRDDRGTEFVLRCAVQEEEAAIALLDTIVRNYQPDGEKEQADATFLPAQEEPDLQNGTFGVSFEDLDRLETDGYCTAVLYTTDHFSAEDVRAMKPGDTLRVNGRTCTLTDIDEPSGEVEIDLKEADAGQSFWGTVFIPNETEDRYVLYLMDDWYSVSRVGSVRVDASQAVAFYDMPGMEEPELLHENVFSTESVIRTLTELSPYNTTCTLEDGRVVRIDAGSYPVGPVDPFIPVDP